MKTHTLLLLHWIVFTASGFSQSLKITTGTGADDLRGGQVATIQLNFKSGAVSRAFPLNNGQGWAKFTENISYIPMDETALNQVAGITITFDGSPRNFPDTYDNWDLAKLQVAYVDGPDSKLVFSTEGNPVAFRFTGQQTQKNWRLTGNADDFHFGTLGSVQRGTLPLLVIRVNYEAGNTIPANRLTRYQYEHQKLFWGNMFPNVASYFYANSNKKLQLTSAGFFDVTVPAGSDDEEVLRRFFLRYSPAAIDFSRFDKNHNYRIEPHELAILVVDAPKLTCGQSRPKGLITILPNTGYKLQLNKISYVGEYANFRTVCHELFHQIGMAYDLYAFGSLTVMDATCFHDADFEASQKDRTTYYIDPWHRMRVGWTKPQIHNVRMGTAHSILYVPQISDQTQTLIVYDPARYDINRKKGEFFLLEYRNSAQGGYDANVFFANQSNPNSGLVIWQVEQDENGYLLVSPINRVHYSSFTKDNSRGGNRPWKMNDGKIVLKYVNRETNDEKYNSGIAVSIVSQSPGSMQLKIELN